MNYNANGSIGTKLVRTAVRAQLQSRNLQMLALDLIDQMSLEGLSGAGTHLSVSNDSPWPRGLRTQSLAPQTSAR